MPPWVPARPRPSSSSDHSTNWSKVAETSVFQREASEGCCSRYPLSSCVYS